MARLTEKRIAVIAAAPGQKGGRDIPDDGTPGLYLTVRTTGTKTWCFRYRFAGCQRRFVIGPVGPISLKEARRRADALRVRVNDGGDPQAEKLAAKSQQEAEHIVADAFPDMARRFIEEYALGKNRTALDQARMLGLRKTWLTRRRPELPPVWETIPGSLCERWAQRDVATITRREANEAINEYMQRGEHAAAVRFRATLSRFFGWLVEQGVIDQSPLTGTRPPARLNSRKRVLADWELSLVWTAAGALKSPFDAYVRFLVLTGARRSEVAGARLGEIDGDVWTIPAERSKTREPNALPLPDEALKLVGALLLRENTSGLLFTTNDRTPISGFSKMKAQVDSEMMRLSGAEIEHWTLHDIRRSVATGMASIGIEPHIIEAVLNHRTGIIKGVARTYNRHLYLDEKRDALAQWSRQIVHAKMKESAEAL
jgi:integrase